MTQTESNACLEVGLEVNYVSARGATWDATVTKLHEHEYCDLSIHIGPYSAHPAYLIRYDSNGGLNSWHKKSDVVSRVEVGV